MLFDGWKNLKSFFRWTSGDALPGELSNHPMLLLTETGAVVSDGGEKGRTKRPASILQPNPVGLEIRRKPYMVCPSEIGSTMAILVGGFMNMKSRMNREVHVRFCGKAGVRFLCLIRLAGNFWATVLTSNFVALTDPKHDNKT